MSEENNEVKREIPELDEQESVLINQKDVKKLELDEQLSSEIEALDLSEKHSASDEASHQCQSKTNPVNFYFPADIATDIFSKLSVKYLLRCKSVEKSWGALISTPEFVKYYTSLLANDNKNHTENSVILRMAQPEINLEEYPVMEELDQLDYYMKDSGESCAIVSSFNGLICLVNEAYELFLWNPATQKSKKLPDFRTTLKDDGYCTYGFGYDDIHHDYKVMCIFSITTHRHHFQEVNVYSLKDDSWRTVNCSRNVTRLVGSAKFSKGKLYWATSDNLRSGWSIISFDLINEKWGKVELPYDGIGDDILVLGVVGDSLSMIRSDSTTHVDVWALKESENKLQSWRKIFTLNYSLYPVDYLFSHSFYLSKRGEFLLVFHDTYMIFDPKDNTTSYSKIGEFDYGTLTEFFQTLVCPLSEKETTSVKAAGIVMTPTV